jgi:hypothetical protein
MSEPPFLFLLFSAFALFLAGLDDQKLWKFPAAGVVLGLAYLTREEAIAFFAALSILGFVWLLTVGRPLALKAWRAIALFALLFVLIAAPYVWYLHVHTGQWMISGKLHITWKAGGYREEGWKTQDQMYFGLDSSGAQINWLSAERYQGNVLSKVLAHPGDLLYRVIRNAGRLKDNFFTRTNFWWVLTPLVILALFNQPWSLRRLKYEAFFMTMLAILLVSFLPFGYLARYFAPAFPILLMWTARGALELGEWLQETIQLSGGRSLSNPHIKAGVGWFPGVVIVLALVLTIPLSADREIGAMYLGDKEAGLWLKRHIPGDAKVMAQDLAVALYAGRGWEWVPSPNADWERFMKFARARRAKYLVVRDHNLAVGRPELASAVRNGVPELELLHTFEEPHRPGRITTFVYRIKLS